MIAIRKINEKIHEETERMSETAEIQSAIDAGERVIIRNANI